MYRLLMAGKMQKLYSRSPKKEKTLRFRNLYEDSYIKDKDLRDIGKP